MIQEERRIVKANSIQFDVELDDGRSAIMKFKPTTTQFSANCSPCENIMTVSFSFSSFEMEVGNYEDVQFNNNAFMKMLGYETDSDIQKGQNGI